MKITNAGRGIHVREIGGVDRFRSDLPAKWYGFTNLDLALDAGKAREIDIIIVAELRIFLVDLKDWHGQISSLDGRWQLNGVDKDASPVAKITDTARRLAILLSRELKKRAETRDLPAPKIEGLVILTGKAGRSGIAETERAKVLTADEFIGIVKDGKREREVFGNIAGEFLSRPLTDLFWKDKLTRFFNAGPSSPFKPGKRRFERFIANDVPSFSHPKEIYAEYDAVEEGNKNNLGTLRLWDFGKCDTRFQSEEGRLEIAGREQQVYHWLLDRSEETDQILLTPKIDDPDRGVHYWEIYDRRRRLQRLALFAETEAARLLPVERVELARQMLSALASLHRHDAAHLDLGGHSIWIEAPTTIKFSHLLATRFPEVKSLGKSRYQFLASVDLPDDVLGVDRGPKCRDVYLVGVAIHQLFFGSIPGGKPPEWNSAIDAKTEFEPLHNWLAQALEIDANSRFSDALVALNAFNNATMARPTPDEVVASLDRFRTDIRSQRQLFSAYPMAGNPILESDRIEIWRSENSSGSVVVKLWKQAAWGDLKREGTAILAFLERAIDTKADRPPGLPTIRDAFWLGDAFAVIQDWVNGETLAEKFENSSEEMRSPLAQLLLLRRLIETIIGVHDRGFGHGDLKPANIVIDRSGYPVLIDTLDFSPRSDGELVSSAYAPESGSIFERDRFAIIKIAEEVLTATKLSTADFKRLASGIAQCRDTEPRLSTLLPLLDEVEAVIEKLERPPAEEPVAPPQEINISILGAETGQIAPDEGYLFLRVYRNADRGILSLIIRGAVEEIDVRLDSHGQMLFARRRSLEQRVIRRFASHEFHKIQSVLTVTRNDLNDLKDLLPILESPIIRRRLIDEAASSASSAQTDSEEMGPAKLSDEEAEERLTEEVASSVSEDTAIDVPKLWRTLMDVENELTIEGIALLESSFDRKTNRHRIPLELESGVFEFARNDTVGVERQDKNGRWRRIGDLDVQLSRPELAVINASDLSSAYQGRLVEEGQRLRFTSHFEIQSLRRRTDAVDRILGGNGRSRDLLSVFAHTDANPTQLLHDVDRELLALYELNRDQEEAFERIVRCRPVGLLQGPPGTGKTRFIAALTHYAITKRLARNVLLSSQSHEAVNTAGEAVLSLFRKTGEQPSLLRVAMDEELVSPPLRAFHSAKVEQAIKDKFKASFRERMVTVGHALGLPDNVVGDIVALETNIRPIVTRISELVNSDAGEEQRFNGLIETLESHLKALNLSDLGTRDVSDFSDFMERMAESLMMQNSQIKGINADRIDRLRGAATIGRDFIYSVSRMQRSFESFLAGTRKIVVGTCVGLGRTSLGLTNTGFDLVIVDEAARCTASELLVPLQAARWAVLVGDHAQLEPHHKPEVVNLVSERTGFPKREIRRSDFERLFLTEYGKGSGARLKTQYRMWPTIGTVVSETFYPDLILEPGRTEPEVDPSLLPASLDKPLIWVETDALGEAAFDRREDAGSSRVNRLEASTIMSLLEEWHAHDAFRDWLRTQQKHPAGIGIICMYAAQRDLIRQRLRQSSLAYLLDQHVKVGTVDSYQGKENPIVLLTLVRNNEDGLLENGVRCIQEGFLAASNRINVAVSRAMDRLVIVGARRRWPSCGPLSRLSDSFERQVSGGNARVIDAQALSEREASDVHEKRIKSKAVQSRTNMIAGGESG